MPAEATTAIPTASPRRTAASIVIRPPEPPPAGAPVPLVLRRRAANPCPWGADLGAPPSDRPLTMAGRGRMVPTGPPQRLSPRTLGDRPLEPPSAALARRHAPAPGVGCGTDAR